MKSKKAEIVRRVHALPEVSFEDHRLTSFAGLVLFMALFRRLRLARRLRRCFAAVDRTPKARRSASIPRIEAHGVTTRCSA